LNYIESWINSEEMLAIWREN